MKNAARILRFGTAVLALAVLVPTAAPIEDPVQWALTVDTAATPPGGRVLATLTATIDPGWHLYSLTTPKGGPNATTVTLADNPAVAGFRVSQPRPHRQMDPNFRIETETFGENLKLLVEVVLKPDAAPGLIDLEARVRYQCCTDKICLPPRLKIARAALQVDAPRSAAFKIPPEYLEAASFGDVGPAAGATPPPDAPAVKPAAAPHQSKPSVAAPPATAPVQVAPPATSAGPESPTPARAAPPLKPAGGDRDTIGFLLVAFGFGVAAIFTPCVFPMIPITVSFFLNQAAQGRRGSLAQAFVFCLGIVVLFTSLGAVTKAIARPFGVVVLGSSPWVNGVDLLPDRICVRRAHP